MIPCAVFRSVRKAKHGKKASHNIKTKIVVAVNSVDLRRQLSSALRVLHFIYRKMGAKHVGIKFTN